MAQQVEPESPLLRAQRHQLQAHERDERNRELVELSRENRDFLRLLALDIDGIRYRLSWILCLMLLPLIIGLVIGFVIGVQDS